MQEEREFADALAAAWKAATHLGADVVRPRIADRAAAYRIQDAMAEALGETLTGWKVGATSAKMRELDGHDDVIPGRMFASTTWQGSRHDLPIARFPRARVETEFAFRLTADAPLSDRPWRATDLEGMLAFHPAVEIIGNRYHPETPPPSSLETIADNGGGIGFVFGDEVADWQGTDFQRHHITLTVDGGTQSDNFLGEMRCQPVAAVADLLNHLAGRGYGMKRGDWVSTGAATVPLHIHAGAHVAADFGTLGRIDLRFV